MFQLFEDLLTLNLLLYDIDIVDGNTIGGFAGGSVRKNEITVRLLRYNNLIDYVGNNNTVLQFFRWTNCDIFFNRTFNMERNLTARTERVGNV